jgi:hypothetical protein
MVVKVLGRQWNWAFQYPNGKQTTLLYSALGKPMKLELRSADVIHGFYVPAFKGLFGSEETLIVDGEERKARVDEAFLEKAIQEPMADRVKGYPPTMPPNPLTPKELMEVFDYMRSLK